MAVYDSIAEQRGRVYKRSVIHLICFLGAWHSVYAPYTCLIYYNELGNHRLTAGI